MRAPTTVDEYLSWQSDEARVALSALRDAIHAAAPDAVDTISYKMAASRLDGRALVCYAAFTDHYSLFPMSKQVIADHADELGARTTGKGTIRFEYGERLPVGLVRKIVRARAAEIETKRAAR